MWFIRRVPKADDQSVASGSIRACDLVHDLGYASTESVERFLEILSHCSPLTTDDVARLVGMMASHYAGLYQPVDRDKEREARALQAAWLSREGDIAAGERFTWCLPVVVQTIQSLVHFFSCLFGWFDLVLFHD